MSIEIVIMEKLQTKNTDKVNPVFINKIIIF